MRPSFPPRTLLLHRSSAYVLPPDGLEVLPKLADNMP